MKKQNILILLVLFSNLIYGQCWQKIDAGSQFNIALKTDGTLWGWGNMEGAGYVPIQINSSTNWQSISAGGQHSLALKTDGTLWSWCVSSPGIGNLYGQLGDGTNINHTIPLQIGTDSNWLFIDAGYIQSFAIKTNGTLWACGNNSQGQLGDGTLIDRNILTQIGSDNDWRSITQSNSAGNNFTIGIKTNGTLWAWGSNNSYQLGDNTTINKIIPTQIGTDNNWQTISAGAAHVIAIKTDGTLWAWGNNQYGQLCDGTTINKTIPTQIGIQTNWQNVSASQNSSFIKKSNGTIWSCGYNSYSQLGLADNPIIYSGLNQIGTDSNWVYTSSGAYHSIAIKNNNTIYSWGANFGNQLGYNTFPQTFSGAPRIINCTSLNNEEFATNNKDFKLFPNPTKNLISILNSFNKNIEQIKIIDSYGKIVLEQSKDFHEINLQNLQSGIYIIQILSEGERYNSKIVKD